MRDIQIFKATRGNDDQVLGLVPSINTSNTITGKTNLTQRVLKVFYTGLGTNAYHQNIGTNKKDVFSQIYKNSEKRDVQVMVSQLISQVQQFIQNEQTQYPGLLLEEQLDSIKIIDILYNKDTNRWKIKLSIYNRRGQVSIMEI